MVSQWSNCPQRGLFPELKRVKKTKQIMQGGYALVPIWQPPKLLLITHLIGNDVEFFLFLVNLHIDE